MSGVRTGTILHAALKMVVVPAPNFENKLTRAALLYAATSRQTCLSCQNAFAWIWPGSGCLKSALTGSLIRGKLAASPCSPGKIVLSQCPRCSWMWPKRCTCGMLDYPDVPQMRRQIVINCHALGYQNITIFKENPNMGTTWHNPKCRCQHPKKTLQVLYICTSGVSLVMCDCPKCCFQYCL